MKNSNVLQLATSYAKRQVRDGLPLGVALVKAEALYGLSPAQTKAVRRNLTAAS